MCPFLAIPCNALIIRTNNHPIITHQSPAPRTITQTITPNRHPCHRVNRHQQPSPRAMQPSPATITHRHESSPRDGRAQGRAGCPAPARGRAGRVRKAGRVERSGGIDTEAGVRGRGGLLTPPNRARVAGTSIRGARVCNGAAWGLAWVSQPSSGCRCGGKPQNPILRSRV